MNKQQIVVKAPNGKRLGRPPRVDRPREHIIAVAAQMFATKGFDATSMEEISSAVGASKAGIYHYFKSKSALYDDLIIGTLTEMLEVVSVAVEAETSPPAKMRAYLSSHIGYVEGNFPAVSIIVQSTSLQNRAFSRPEVELRVAFEAVIGQIISEGIEAGCFRDVDVAVMQKAILGMVAWIPKWHPSTRKVKTGQIIDTYVDLILRGLATESDPDAIQPARANRTPKAGAPDRKAPVLSGRQAAAGRVRLKSASK